MYYYHRQWMIDNVSTKVSKLHKVWFSTHSNYVFLEKNNFQLQFGILFLHQHFFDQQLNDNQLPIFGIIWFLKDCWMYVFKKLKMAWVRKSIVFWIFALTFFFFLSKCLSKDVKSVLCLFSKKIDARKISNKQYLVTNRLR